MKPEPEPLADVPVRYGPWSHHASSGSYSHHGGVLIRPHTEIPFADDITRHELAHYWLNASTPYGLFLHELADLQYHQVVPYCMDLFEGGKPIIVPAYPAARRLLSGDHSWFDAQGLDGDLYALLAERYLRPWADAVYVEATFEGETSAGKSPAAKAVRALDRCERAIGRDRTGTELFGSAYRGPGPISDYQRKLLAYWAKNLDTEPFPAAPTIRPRSGGPRPFGARDLFECHAQQQEAYGSQDPELPRALADTEYFSLWLLLVTRHMEHRRDQGGSKTADEWTQLQLTFAALIDVALFVPCGDVYGRFRNDQMHWFDVHPGSRFMSALDALQVTGWIEEPADIPRLQDDVSRRCGWPLPERFLEVGAQLEPASIQLARHRAACRMRLEQPNRMVFNPIDDVTNAFGRFVALNPPMQIVGGLTAAVPGETPAEKFGQILEYTTAALNWQVMITGEVDLSKCLPPGLYDGNTFANVRSPEDLLEVIGNAIPFFRDAEIVRVPPSFADQV